MHDDSPDNRRDSSATLALSVLVCGVVGGFLALLLARDLGRRTRQRLRDLVAEAREHALDAVKEVRDRIEEVIDQEPTLVEAKAVLSSAYEAGREAFHHAREQGQAQCALAGATDDAAASMPEGRVSVS